MFEIRPVSSETEIREAKRLLQEYADWLNMEMTYERIGKEIAEFPGEFGPPTGKFFLGLEGSAIVGSVAVRKREQPGVCEMKRLFVRPEFRGKGYGRILAERIIDEARELGYERMRLDTLPYMKEAIGLYKELGFVEIGQYTISPTNDAQYFELIL